MDTLTEDQLINLAIDNVKKTLAEHDILMDPFECITNRIHDDKYIVYVGFAVDTRPFRTPLKTVAVVTIVHHPDTEGAFLISAEFEYHPPDDLDCPLELIEQLSPTNDFLIMAWRTDILRKAKGFVVSRIPKSVLREEANLLLEDVMAMHNVKRGGPMSLKKPLEIPPLTKKITPSARESELEAKLKRKPKTSANKDTAPAKRGRPKKA